MKGSHCAQNDAQKDKTMKEYESMNPEQLLAELLKEVVYDAHSVWISYQRSDAGKEFLKRDPRECFRVLADCLALRQEKPMMQHFSENERETETLIHLLYALPESEEMERPYDRNVPYGKQEFGIWTIYCRGQELRAVKFKPVKKY